MRTSQRICKWRENPKHCPCGKLPACCFPPEIEKTYDRSIERFIEYYSQHKMR